MKKKRSTTFTPGPWEVERHDQDDGSIEYEIWNHSPEHYTRIVTVSDENDDANAKNNALLMAAAPELYGAMQFILAFYEPGQRYLDTEAWKVAEASARAAMRKARGETVSSPAT